MLQPHFVYYMYMPLNATFTILIIFTLFEIAKKSILNLENARTLYLCYYNVV